MGTRAATPAAAALVVQVLLLVAVAGIAAHAGVGLSTAGWIVGVSCGLVTDSALAFGVTHYRSERLTKADRVTLARATLAACVAALVVDSFARPVPVALVVSLSAVALALDAVDGWVARRTGTGPLGARFDGEVDAFLILVLSVYVAGSLGGWVIAIGAFRYAFVLAGWALPWLLGDLPRRRSRSAVAAVQGLVLVIAAAGVVPTPVTATVVAGSLAALSWSFGRDIRYLHQIDVRQRAIVTNETAVVRTAPAAEPFVGVGQ